MWRAENRYFLIEETNFVTADGQPILLVSRKKPSLFGSAPLMLELLAHAIVRSPGLTFVASPKVDLDMIECLQSCGLIKCDILSSNSDLQLFEMNRRLSHDMTFAAYEYLEFCRQRERYFLGLSQNSSWTPKTKQIGVGPQEQKFNSVSRFRMNLDFDTIVERRKSTESFSGGKPIQRSSLEVCLRDTVLRRTDGSYPIGCAGGIWNIELKVIADCVIGLESGFYSFDPDGNWLIKEENATSPTDIFVCGFSQELFIDCQTFIAVVYDLQELAEKYGARAGRFSLFTAGAVLDRIQLSCTSLGLRSRVMGGFDDFLAEKLLGLNSPSKRVAAFVGIGGEA